MVASQVIILAWPGPWTRWHWICGRRCTSATRCTCCFSRCLCSPNMRRTHQHAVYVQCQPPHTKPSPEVSCHASQEGARFSVTAQRSAPRLPTLSSRIFAGLKALSVFASTGAGHAALRMHAHAAGALRAAMRDRALLFSAEQAAKLQDFVARSKVGSCCVGCPVAVHGHGSPYSGSEAGSGLREETCGLSSRRSRSSWRSLSAPEQARRRSSKTELWAGPGAQLRGTAAAAPQQWPLHRRQGQMVL